MNNMKPVLLLVACAAPPATEIGELVEQLIADGWDVYVVLTHAAAAWVDMAPLEAATGHAVRTEARQPGEPKSLPPADAVVVAPATFNMINQWAAGINNTAALGILNGALGAGTPVIASPYAKTTLAAHPAFGRSLELLGGAGVHFTATDALRPSTPDGPYAWEVILNILRNKLVTDSDQGADSEATRRLRASREPS
jgi:phosphopantothenoylcysteine decarboxylase